MGVEYGWNDRESSVSRSEFRIENRLKCASNIGSGCRTEASRRDRGPFDQVTNGRCCDLVVALNGTYRSC